MTHTTQTHTHQKGKKDVQLSQRHGQGRKERLPQTEDQDRSLRDTFDSWFGESSWLDPIEFRTSRLLSRFDQAFFPRVDISDTGKEIKVVADVPGVDPDNIHIDIEGDQLRLSGMVEREQEWDEGEKPYRYERTYGSFERTFTLPAAVKESEAKAVCGEGVLTITASKIQQKARASVPVERTE